MPGRPPPVGFHLRASAWARQLGDVGGVSEAWERRSCARERLPATGLRVPPIGGTLSIVFPRSPAVFPASPDTLPRLFGERQSHDRNLACRTWDSSVVECSRHQPAVGVPSDSALKSRRRAIGLLASLGLLETTGCNGRGHTEQEPDVGGSRLHFTRKMPTSRRRDRHLMLD